jgi:drug/metabolite transporter (DMT)-like permease
MVSIQVIASLSIPLVPFLSWIISGERLAMIHYVGLGIAFLGALLLSLNKKIEKRAFRTVGFTMIGMVFFFVSEYGDTGIGLPACERRFLDRFSLILNGCHYYRPCFPFGI